MKSHIFSAEPISHMTRRELILEKAQRGLVRCPQLVIKITWAKINMSPLKSRARLKITSLAEFIVGIETVKPILPTFSFERYGNLG